MSYQGTLCVREVFHKDYTASKRLKYI